MEESMTQALLAEFNGYEWRPSLPRFLGYTVFKHLKPLVEIKHDRKMTKSQQPLQFQIQGLSWMILCHIYCVVDHRSRKPRSP